MSEQQSDVPRGVPASGAGAFYDMIANDPPPAIRSVTSDLLDQQLADRRPPGRGSSAGSSKSARTAGDGAELGGEDAGRSARGRLTFTAVPPGAC